MDPRDLINGLLLLRERSPTAFLKDHNLGHLQPTFSKWLNRKTSNPRRDWVEPVARAFGVKPAAMLDEAIASEEAARMGVRTMHVAESPPPPYARRAKQARIDAGTLALQIGDLMRAFDQDIREAAAPLFKVAAAQPDRAPEMAEKLRQLLTIPDDGKRTGTHG